MIKILGKKYDIVFKDDSVLNTGMVGHYDGTKNRIDILRGMSKDQTNETILHESIHAISDALGLELEERDVTSLSTAIFAVLRDNHIKVDFKQT